MVPPMPGKQQCIPGFLYAWRTKGYDYKIVGITGSGDVDWFTRSVAKQIQAA